LWPSGASAVDAAQRNGRRFTGCALFRCFWCSHPALTGANLSDACAWQSAGLLVVAATNRADRLDAALLRYSLDFASFPWCCLSRARTFLVRACLTLFAVWLVWADDLLIDVLFDVLLPSCRPGRFDHLVYVPPPDAGTFSCLHLVAGFVPSWPRTANGCR
jgi:hypothetical protein